MYKRIILLITAALCLGAKLHAQDVVIDFLNEAKMTGGPEEIMKGNNVKFNFTGDTNKYGALLYGGTWSSTYFLKITAPTNIAVIEYQTTVIKASNNDNPGYTSGDMSHTGDTWVWRGNTSSLTLSGDTQDGSSVFRIKRLRLWFNESDYQEGLPWGTEGEGGDTQPYTYDVDFSNDQTNYNAIDRLYSSAPVLPTNGKGVPMAVVSHRMFEPTLQPYLKWKTQQGYQVTELYTDAVSDKQGKELAYALREKLKAMNPRPSYVLLVGDVAQVPAFSGITGSQLHMTDYYYGEFTGDRFADAYVGRFSATNPTELQAQLDKTQFMAQIKPSEGTWLKQSITVDNVTSDIQAMNEAVSLSMNYPKNFDGNTTEKAQATWQETINNKINNGCSFVNYFGHGSIAGWNNSYTTYYVDKLTNQDRYPVVLSITCLTGTYDLDCMAEHFMRKANAGAVAVLAASMDSYANSNNNLFLGSNLNGNQKALSIGLFRSLFPFVGSDPSQRARTLGHAFDIALHGLARSVSQSFTKVAEFYNIFGDPTYQPYITTPKANKLLSSSYNITAGRCVSITTAPEAVVCLSQDRTVIVAAVADKDGRVTLRVPSNSPTGDCMLYSSAPSYNDVCRKVTVSAGNGTQEWTDDDNLPHITHTDIITLASAGDAVNNAWPSAQQTLPALESSARYAVWATTEQYRISYDPIAPWETDGKRAESIYMLYQKGYAHCGIATIQSGGKARTVTAEWSHPTGNAEVIGVYGSNSAYANTDQGFGSSKGEKLGELVKGTCNSLTLPGDYKFILLRPEPRLQNPETDNMEVFLKSISIGWEKELTKCATPKISFRDGELQFSCTTNGASYKYGITPASGSNITISVVAEAPNYAPSDEATLTIDGSQLTGNRGDIDKNGTINLTDLTKFINILKTKK
ncbi:MAG: hypothetical protein KBT12_05950 [Bacteroidales bacterium]|nr:hypothetical protein [Candidatus Physcousia equi]